MNKVIPWLIVKVYRMVPPSIRGHYPGFTVSTSHLFQYGDGWGRIAQLVGDSKPPRPKMPHE